MSTLHIITPAYRFENLESIYNSILINDDIIWHISKSNKREELNFDFIKKDKRIKIYNVNCEDNEIYKKRNAVFEKIKDGYFCLLDDDTIFHENMYMKYRECIDQLFIGMLVGEQLNHVGKLRLPASRPIFCKIDTGNVLSHTNCLEQCKWPETHTHKVNQKDFLFWESVYHFYDKQCTLIHQPISYYNKLKPIKQWQEKKQHLL